MSVAIAVKSQKVWDVGTQAWVAAKQALLSTENLSVTVQSPLSVTGTFYPATQPISGTVTTEEPRLVTRLDTIGGNLTYVGTAVAGSTPASATWRIKKLEYSGTDVTSILYADGDTEPDNVWNNRTSLDYS